MIKPSAFTIHILKLIFFIPISYSYHALNSHQHQPVTSHMLHCNQNSNFHNITLKNRGGWLYWMHPRANNGAKIKTNIKTWRHIFKNTVKQGLIKNNTVWAMDDCKSLWEEISVLQHTLFHLFKLIFTKALPCVSCDYLTPWVFGNESGSRCRLNSHGCLS